MAREREDNERRGNGRRDEVGRSGIWPASGPLPPGKDVPIVDQGELGRGARGAAGHEDRGTSETMIFRTDPVCGVNVNPEHAEHAEYRNATYFFDSTECKEKFERAPERFAGTPEPPTR